MRKTLSRVLIIGILILTPNLISYANGPGTTTANFLKIGIGARATAMGEAFTALSNDGTSLYWNPAGLIQMEKRELSATYNLWFQQIKQGYLGFGFPSLGGIVGLGANYVDMGEIEGRDDVGNDPLPLTLKMGIAWSGEALTLAADVAKPQDNDLYWCVGAEWWMREIIALRAGYKTNQDIAEGWSAGLGFKFQRIHLDYAYVPYGDLGNTHRISLGMKF